MEERKKFKVHCKCSTWSRDSHMLFDYENQDTTRKTLQIQTNSYLSRSVQEITSSSDPSDECLLYISLHSPTFSVSSFEPFPLWQVIRSPKDSPTPTQYPLFQGSVIKLGRLQFEVKLLKTTEDFLDCLHVKRVNDDSLTCRICFIEDQPTDPLISVCKCAGSIQFIHVGCLQSWILSKLTPSEENPALRFLKSIHCELCKEKLPFLLNVDGQRFDMLTRFKPKVPFLILEGIHGEAREPGVYFISFAEKDSVMLGRGHDSDVRIPDISVSRCHAMILFRKGEFFVQDNGSKFGTLVKLESPFVVEDRIVVQCGRSVVELEREERGREDKFEWEEGYKV